LNSLIPSDLQIKDKQNNEMLLHLNQDSESFFKKIFRNILNNFYNFHEYRLFNRKKYMITPCLHVYHSHCLEAWIIHKKECPSDRAPLGDIEY